MALNTQCWMTYSLTFNKKSKLTFKKTIALFAKNHMRWSSKMHNFISKSFILLFRLFYKSNLQDNKQKITNHSSHSFLFPHYYIKPTCYVSIISFLLLTLSSLHHSSFYKENIFLTHARQVTWVYPISFLLVVTIFSYPPIIFTFPQQFLFFILSRLFCFSPSSSSYNRDYSFTELLRR